MKSFIFLGFSLLLIIVNQTLFSSEVAHKKIDKTVERIVKTEKAKVEFREYTESLFRSIIGFIGNTLKDRKTLIRRMAIFIISVLVLFLLSIGLIAIYETMISRSISNNRKNRGINSIVNGELTLSELNRLENENRFNEALVLMHRMSVQYLNACGIVIRKNETNRGFLRLIGDSSLREPFERLFVAAEMISFDNYCTDNAFYQSHRQIFNDCFISADTGANGLFYGNKSDNNRNDNRTDNRINSIDGSINGNSRKNLTSSKWNK